jgi:hypothetical protein
MQQQNRGSRTRAPVMDLAPTQRGEMTRYGHRNCPGTLATQWLIAKGFMATPRPPPYGDSMVCASIQYA